MLHFFLFIHVQKYDDKRYRIFFMRFPYFAFVYACGFACAEVPFLFWSLIRFINHRKDLSTLLFNCLS